MTLDVKLLEFENLVLRLGLLKLEAQANKQLPGADEPTAEQIKLAAEVQACDDEVADIMAMLKGAIVKK